MPRPSSILLLSSLIACGNKDDDPIDSAAASPTWYSTCGDPSCAGYAGPTDGVPTCTTETEGDTCTPEGVECDLQTDCNTFLRCTTEDPKDQPGGCPISRARHKTHIQYISTAERQHARETLLNTRLATWRYHWDSPDRRLRLGFLIDDQPLSPAVHEGGEHVDLYGYTSLTVAAVQAQDVELQQLRTELAENRAALQRLQAEVAAMRRAEPQSP